MNDQIGPSSLLDTTDSLEAVSVFRGWKNLMFLIVFLCLLLTQSGFWLVNTGLVDTDCAGCAKAEACPAAAIEAAAVAPVEVQDPNKATADPNKPALAAPTETTAEAKASPKSVLNDILQKVTIRRLCPYTLGLRLCPDHTLQLEGLDSRQAGRDKLYRQGVFPCLVYVCPAAAMAESFRQRGYRRDIHALRTG
jgi:hypothetical protein